MIRDTPAPNDDDLSFADRTMTRRDALRLAIALAGVVIDGCRSTPATDAPRQAPGRLTARPGRPRLSPVIGRSSLGLASGRDGIVYVPERYNPSRPAPLVLMLHGAGQSAEIGIAPFLPLADAAGVVLVAPDSRGRTWDFLYGPYSVDVAFIDRALGHVFEQCAIDPSRVVIEGFSDGASYALSLGITNGDLFSRVIAFSPCILAPAAQVGHPLVFISHGTNDRILPIDGCGRRLATRLTNAGYVVELKEFVGPHTVPPDVAKAAIEWIQNKQRG
ncbi:MAG TPA: alpha/beta hydrolase-fold protein [Gemmatimonadaceae bacterium]